VIAPDRDPAAVATLPTAVQAAYTAAERTGQRLRLGAIPEFTLVVLGPTDAGKTALVSALLSDATGELIGLAERPGRGTTVPVEYVYGENVQLWLGIGATTAEPADWVGVPPGTSALETIPDLRRIRAILPARVLHDWSLRIIDCPGLDGPEGQIGPLLEEAHRPGVGVAYVVPRRGIAEIDAQALEMLRHTPTVLIENRRDAEMALEQSTLDELTVPGLPTGLAIPLATRRLAEPGPERETLRRCVALLRTRTAPDRWTTGIHAAALRSRDKLCADYARRHTMALMARHPDRLGALGLLADLLGIERDGPGVIDLDDRLAQIAELAQDAQPAPALRTLIDHEVRSIVDRYNLEAAQTSSARLRADERSEAAAFGQSYAELRDDLVALLHNVLADQALQLTDADRATLTGLRTTVLDDQLEVAVLGPCSSGKSSLINALLGLQPSAAFLPTSPRPMTSTVNEVRHAPQPSLAVSWLPQVELRLLSPGAEPNQVRVHVDEARALARWLRDRSVSAKDCQFRPLVPGRAGNDGEAAFWRLWKMLDLGGEPQLYAYLAPSPDQPRLTDLSVPAEVSINRFVTTPDKWPGTLERERAFADLSSDPALALRVDTVQLGFPHPLLKHVTIVDTPGTDAPIPHHRITAHRAVRDKRQCAVIYCFDGAKPGSHEDSANLAFLRECRIGSSDLSRFFFVITRRGVAEAHQARVRQTVDEALASAGAGAGRTYFTEVVAELNDDFRLLAADLDRFVLSSKGALLRAWSAHFRQVLEDLYDRHVRQIDSFTETEQNRLARLDTLEADVERLTTLRGTLSSSPEWGEPGLRRRMDTAVDAGITAVERRLDRLATRRAFAALRLRLASDVEQLNRLTRQSLEDGCAAAANALADELARRLPGRRITPPELVLDEEFFAVADLEHAVATVSWRSGWDRVRALFSPRRWQAEADANRLQIAAAWELSRDRGLQALTGAADRYLNGLRAELDRLAAGIADEIAVAAREPSPHDRTTATEGRDRTAIWLGRLDALTPNDNGGRS
jgi:energy-coupling factor transporter ATP-binding protein EcfA2